MNAAAHRLVFASEQFPEDATEPLRRRRWQEFVEEGYGCVDMSFAHDRRFSARIAQARVNGIVVDAFQASLTRTARTARHIARDGNVDFLLGLNCGRRAARQRQLGREVDIVPGAAMLLSNAEPAEVTSAAGFRCLSVYIPRAELLERIEHADDLVARPIDTDPSVTRYFRRYLRLLLSPDNDLAHPALARHATASLLDLAAAMLEPRLERRELPARRGLRGARLIEVLSEIKANYGDPAFSAAKLAAKLRVTPRYIQDLLHETGKTFSERVLELRLDKARAMLADSRNDNLKVSEIAYACGFNEISYFNRCFRTRFGISPTQDRGGRVA